MRGIIFLSEKQAVGQTLVCKMQKKLYPRGLKSALQVYRSIVLKIPGCAGFYPDGAAKTYIFGFFCNIVYNYLKLRRLRKTQNNSAIYFSFTILLIYSFTPCVIIKSGSLTQKSSKRVIPVSFFPV